MKENGDKVVRRSEKTLRGMQRVGLMALGIAGYGATLVAIIGYAIWGLEVGAVGELGAITAAVFATTVLNVLVNIASI